MSSRRAFLASAATGGVGGCLGSLRGSVPTFVVKARTLNRDDGPLLPKIAVRKPEITHQRPAQLTVFLHNTSLGVVGFSMESPTHHWVRSTPNRDVVLAQRGEANQYADRPEKPCWKANVPKAWYQERLRLFGVPPLLTERWEYDIAARMNEDCMTPGAYRFEMTFELGPRDSLDWSFEVLVAEH